MNPDMDRASKVCWTDTSRSDFQIRIWKIRLFSMCHWCKEESLFFARKSFPEQTHHISILFLLFITITRSENIIFRQTIWFHALCHSERSISPYRDDIVKMSVILRLERRIRMEFLATFLVSVAAGVAVHFISKWLDKHLNHNDWWAEALRKRRVAALLFLCPNGPAMFLHSYISWNTWECKRKRQFSDQYRWTWMIRMQETMINSQEFFFL